MPFDAKTMPKARVSGSPIPHEGSILPEDAAYLAKLGYEVIDIRTTTGPRQVELLFQAVMLQTIDYNAQRMAAAEQIRIYWGKTTKDEVEKGMTEVKEAPNAMKLLEHIGTQQKQEMPLVIPKKRGRPKGSKTKARNQ